MGERNFEASEFSAHPVASEVAEHIRSVIGAAEAAAGAVRHEAEQQVASRRRAAEEEARRIVEDAKRDAEAMLEERVRRIGELSDTIIDRSEGLLSRLDRAEEGRRETQSLLARPGQPTRAEQDDQLLGARLVALQMAVAGGNRGEVEAHLVRAFDLPNPQSILDDVFGRGTDASKRVVWPSAADGS